MSGYSFPNDEDDLHTRLIYIVSAEFIYRLDELLETAHEHPSRTTAHPEMRDIVYESACVALKMLRCLGAESANPADLNFAQFAVGPAGRAFRPAVESLVKAAAKALCVAQRAKVSEQSNLETTKHKAQMLLTLGTAFFAVIAELCASFNLKVDGTLNDRDLVMLRSCIDAALGMLYELKAATWRVGQPVPQEVLDEMAEHVDSNMLKCAGYRAVSAIEQVYAAVLCEASLH